MVKILHSGAKFSKDRMYRYSLWRTWDETLPKVLFIGLNPSTADEIKDDPTIRRCLHYSIDWGFGGYIMGNIFGYRSKDPKKLKDINDPIGPRNNYWIHKIHNEASLTIAAWGNWGNLYGRGNSVLKLVDNMHCLKITKEGHPAHPLYLPKYLKPIKFN